MLKCDQFPLWRSKYRYEPFFFLKLPPFNESPQAIAHLFQNIEHRTIATGRTGWFLTTINFNHSHRLARVSVLDNGLIGRRGHRTSRRILLERKHPSSSHYLTNHYHKKEDSAVVYSTWRHALSADKALEASQNKATFSRRRRVYKQV